MRKRIVLIVLLALFGGFGFFIYRNSAGGPAAEASASTQSDQQPRQTDAGATPTPTSADTVGAGAGGDTEVAGLDRTLRVVSPSVELLAPGIIANNGLKTAPESGYAEASLEVAFRPVDGMKGVRKALAKGGRKETGADIAVVPLPSFVATYERLRALKPHVFFVTGWSRGREAIATADSDALRDPPESDEIELRGLAGEPATFLSLFTLDLAGVPVDSVELTDDDDEIPYAAVGRSSEEFSETPEEHRLRLSTADALGLVPFVAIAPQGFLENHPEALHNWTETWLGGRERLLEDVPKGARLIAEKVEEIEALSLIDLLGWIEFASPRDNARLAGLSGRDAVDLERLFQLSWRIWREVGVLTTPSPKALPISTATIVELVREQAAGGQADESTAQEEDADEEAAEEPDGEVVLVHRHPNSELDEREFVEKIGLVAGLFPRSTLRVTVNWNRPKTDEMIEKAKERFDIETHRLVAGRKVPGRGSASIELYEIE